MRMPCHIGNAGDLLKHGVLAEFVAWRCESSGSLRFIDLVGGEPWREPVPEVVQRVRALPQCALRAVQTDLDENRYYGSGLVDHVRPDQRVRVTGVPAGSLRGLDFGASRIRSPSAAATRLTASARA